MDYKRFISYLYTYIEGEKGVNVGYIRCEQRQEIFRFTLNIQDNQGIEGGRYKVYLYKTDNDGAPVGYYIDELVINKGCGELRKQTASDNVWDTNNRIEDFDGVIVIYDKGHMYVSKWKEEPIQTEAFLSYEEWKEKQDQSDSSPKEKYINESEGLAMHVAELSKGEDSVVSEEYHTQESATIPSEQERKEEVQIEGKPNEQQVDCQESSIENQEKIVENKETDSQPNNKTDVEIAAEEVPTIQPEQQKAEKQPRKKNGISEMTLRLMESRPKLPDFENHEIYDCVRIEPNDIGLLEMENWRLGVNSFLTHGYYNYKYLMLGKLRFQDGMVKAVLGVPGIYDNKEQYIAKIFGFDIFIPLKHTNTKTGNFGYWIVELV